jgi:hypothetical protein
MFAIDALHLISDSYYTHGMTGEKGSPANGNIDL